MLARYPYYRSLIGVGLVGLVMLIWAAVLLTPGRAPLWLLVVLVVALPCTSIIAITTFDIARTANPPRRLGSAIGVVNVGAFLGTLIVGHGDRAGAPDPDARRITRLHHRGRSNGRSRPNTPLWVVGIIQTLRYRRRTIRQLRERDPAAFAAYRRGVHLLPPS